MTYALLLSPGQSKVYYEHAKTFATKELLALSKKMPELGNFRMESLAGISYLFFDINAPEDSSARYLNTVGRLSSFFALYQVEGQLLRPIQADPGYRFPDNINMLKYSGKTNEQFTHMLINLALSACETNCPRPLLLDPLAGKGTTLFLGLMMGLDVIGLEKLPSLCKEAQTFIVKYLQAGHYKHKVSEERQSDKRGKKIAEVFNLSLAHTKEAFDKEPQRLRYICSDTKLTNELLKKNSIDLLVADLPYGVQHMGNDSRNAVYLIDGALPSWVEVLKKGGSIALAFNEFTTKKEKLVEILQSNGLQILDGCFEGYLHRVDQSINRDVIVAVKSKG